MHHDSDNFTKLSVSFKVAILSLQTLREVLAATHLAIASQR